MMRHDQQTTIFGIAFWVLFLSSIGLGFVSHYQWLDIAWVLAIDALAAIASVFFVLEHGARVRGSFPCGGIELATAG